MPTSDRLEKQPARRRRRQWRLAGSPRAAPARPARRAPGIMPRLSALVAHLKTHPKYTSAIGQDLWIVGAAQVIGPSTWKPVLNIQNSAGHPIIVWTKGKANALEIWVDRGDDKGFAFLTINTQPNTTDTTPLPDPRRQRGVEI